MIGTFFIFYSGVPYIFACLSVSPFVHFLTSFFSCSRIKHRPIQPGEIQSRIQRVHRGGHPFPVHVRRGHCRGPNPPPQPPGCLCGADPFLEPVHPWPRRAGTDRRRAGRSAPRPSASAQRCLGLPRSTEAVRRLPGRGVARRTVCFSYSQRCSHTSECPKQPSAVARCTRRHFRLCVETVVEAIKRTMNPGILFFYIL